MSRRLSNWIESFVQYSQVYNTPERYRRWAAVYTLSVAAKRSIAMRSRGSMLTPNLFLLLIGGPSTGKSQVVSAVKSVLIPATKFSLIPPSVTRAGLEDFMKSNLQQRRDPSGKLMMSSECIGLSDEMQGILPDQDLGHLTLYNILFDNPPIHKAVTRSNGEVRLESPYCGIMTGAQPAFLATTLPEQAWGMGFMARSIMVWGVPPPRRSVFDTTFGEVDTKLQEDLIHDLREVHNTYGWFKWDKAAKQLYEEWWVEAGGIPVPKHKRLAAGYNGRRELQILKLSMIFSLAESCNLLVEQKHVANAIKLLLEAESQAQFIFNEMASTGAMMAIEDLLDLVRNASAEGRAVAEGDMIQFLMQRFPATQVHAIIENMLTSKAIQLASNSAVKGMRKFKIGTKVQV